MSPHPVLEIRCLELSRNILETLVRDVHHNGGDIDQRLERNLVSCPSYRCHSVNSTSFLLFLLLLLLTIWVEMIRGIHVGSYVLTHTDIKLKHAKMLNTKSQTHNLLTWAMKHPMALSSSSLTRFMVKGEFPGQMLRSLSPSL